MRSLNGRSASRGASVAGSIAAAAARTRKGKEQTMQTFRMDVLVARNHQDGKPRRVVAVSSDADADRVLMFAGWGRRDVDRQKLADHLDVRRRMERERSRDIGAAAGQRHRQQELIGEVLADGGIMLKIPKYLRR